MKLATLLAITTTLACSIQTDAESKFAIRKKTEIDNSADGVKTTQQGVNYFPLVVGNEWAFRDPSGGVSLKFTFSVKQAGSPDEHMCNLPACFNDPTGSISLAPLTDLLLLERKFDSSARAEEKYFVANDNNTVKLYKALFSDAKFNRVQTIVPAVSPSATMFPNSMQVGDKWQIAGQCFRGHPHGDCQYQPQFEVVAIEDVDTEAGNFKDCVKIKISTGSGHHIYLWLAPNIGPVKYREYNIFYKLSRYKAVLPSATTELPLDPQPAVVKPQPQPRAGANYFPLDIGNRWVLRTERVSKHTYTVENAGQASDHKVPSSDWLEYLGDLSSLKLLKEINSLYHDDGGTKYFVRSSQGVKYATAILEWLEGQVIPAPTNKVKEYILYPQFPKLGEVQQQEQVTLYTEHFGPADYHYSFEIFGFEDVKTPARTFKDCAKIKLQYSASTAVRNAGGVEFLYLAPDFGPVMYVDSNGIVYKLSEYNVQ